MAAAAQAAVKAASRPKTIAKKNPKPRKVVESDSDNYGLIDEVNSDVSSSSSSEITRRINASDKHTKLSAELQSEKAENSSEH